MFRPPQCLKELDYNSDLTNTLYKIAHHENSYPNIIFYGPSGSGKKTRALAFLRELIGDTICKTHTREEIISSNGSKSKINIAVKSSNYHYELTPSDYGVYDKDIINSFIKERTKYTSILSNNPIYYIIYEADKLSNYAQNSLRFLIERQFKTARFIFICQNLNSLIPSLQSRFVQLRVRSPTVTEIKNIIDQIKKRNDNLNNLSRLGITKIINYANELMPVSNNLKQILQLLELSICNGKYHKYELNYEHHLNFLVDCMINPTTKIGEKYFQQIRECIYCLFTCHLNTTEIFKLLVKKIIKSPKKTLAFKKKAIQNAAYYQSLLINSNKDILHLEAFVFNLVNLKKE